MTPEQALKNQGCQKLTYLGDGVYAGFNGAIWIATDKEANDVNIIALEPEVLYALGQYAERISE